MTDAPIQIRKPEVVRQIRRLADLKRQPITEVVATVVADALERVEREESLEERRRRAEQAIARYRALPKTGPMLTDEDLYDEDGFPR